MFGAHKALRFAGIILALVIVAITAWFWSLRPYSMFSTLPAVTVASGNHAGDPINIAFLGNESSITRTFLAAQWLVPDPIDASSTVRIVKASIANTPYPTAPVSNLYLFGQVQDLIFELPTGTVRERHHVRLWKTGETVSGKTLWIGSASYDSGIELSGVTYFPTHHISPNVDGERDFIVTSLQSAGFVQSVSLERNSRPTAWGMNGSGDWYFNDGLVEVFTLDLP